MGYSYKYTPKGRNGEITTRWLKSQKDKAKSLDLLILRAHKEYGNQDLFDLTTNAFLENQIPQKNYQSTSPSTPESSAPVQESTPEPEPQPQPKPKTNSQPKEKPNLGFLSH